MPDKKQEADSPNQPSLFAAYDALAKSGDIKDDPAQRQVLQKLNQLLEQLGAAETGGALTRFLKPQASVQPQKALYIWGGVGRGKSMLMDLFFGHVALEKKRRVHFHAFMQEVHGRIHQLRQNPRQNKSGADPVIVLAQQLAQETDLLCFDELQATDVADATLLYRLFDHLFEDGVVIVSTSNHPPISLYTGGVQRERFAKFIGLIEEHMKVLPLDSLGDYRQQQAAGQAQVYFYPLGAQADRFIQQYLQNAQPQPATLEIQGRILNYISYAPTTGRFTFAELCATPLGPADYLAIAHALDTVILTDIPRLPPEKRNEAKRFVTLIDALYEHKVKLICTAEVPPEAIYGEGDGAFEFGRTVSRLVEMQSVKWQRHE
jgi:cell division protein ZapE